MPPDDPGLQALHVLTVAVIGLLFGSFATALAYRLPRGISMVTKTRSSCPSCGQDLGLFDLIPLFSWTMQKGRCRYCKQEIGFDYPLIEISTLALCLLFYALYGFTPLAFALFALATVITAMTAIDFRHKIIPDALNLAVLLTGVVALVVQAFETGSPAGFIVERGALALGGMAVYGLGSLALRQIVMLAIKREPLGLGDVKFLAAAGFWLGPGIMTLSYIMMVAGFSGIALALVWKKATGEREFPFGPALLFAFLTVLLWQGGAFLVI